MEKAVTDFLGKLGISDTEAQLYVDLLELGPSSIAELTRKSTIPRTTVRENVERLIQKGLVSQTFKGARKKLVAEEPNKAKLLLMDRKLDLENQQRNLDDLENKFEGFVNALYEFIPGQATDSNVVIKYFEGKREVWPVYDEILKADTVYSFADLSRYYEVYPDSMDLWVKAFDENKRREYWDILVGSSKDKEVTTSQAIDRYHVKLLPSAKKDDGIYFADIIVFDQKVAIIDLGDKIPRATVIESPHIAGSIKMLHKYLWDIMD
ncbi:MAG: helix-turn-helix domain-containing protein [Candidatus Dojkabacteria bacterium]|nr:MAG: helix-turn-helix domain-containing protein [Candidatus Dojkabacteria bacterium]